MSKTQKNFNDPIIQKARMEYGALSKNPNEIHYYGQDEHVQFVLNPETQVVTSKYDFYQNGLVQTPVISINHIESCGEAKVPGLWAYYCCSQCVNVSNRFFAMPSSRNRIMGVLLYKYAVEGFLQWGYNFYYSVLSTRKINPYCETDGDMAWPSGDPFSVYPYKDGAISSLRQKVFANALEDIRLLERLEEKLGRERVVAELDRLAGAPLTFFEYPTDERFFERLYQFIFENI